MFLKLTCVYIISQTGSACREWTTKSSGQDVPATSNAKVKSSRPRQKATHNPRRDPSRNKCMCCCGKTFGTQKKRIRHLGYLRGKVPKRILKEAGPNFCNCCQQSFDTEDALKSHYAKQGPIAAAAAVVFAVAARTARIAEKEHREQKCSCCCLRIFKDQRGRSLHLAFKRRHLPMKILLESGKHFCPCCQRSFETEDALKSHFSELRPAIDAAAKEKVQGGLHYEKNHGRLHDKTERRVVLSPRGRGAAAVLASKKKSHQREKCFCCCGKFCP